MESAGDGYIFLLINLTYARLCLTITLQNYFQESNFTYDPKNPSEINHDVLYKEGENMRVSIIIKIKIVLNIFATFVDRQQKCILMTLKIL